ncbi:MAG: hypothetical protein Q8R28_03250 [Dehalococcoidia bacterium]|nr:hypothetical protein [Dehalococcoidia bacterium]
MSLSRWPLPAPGQDEEGDAMTPLDALTRASLGPDATQRELDAWVIAYLYRTNEDTATYIKRMESDLEEELR